MSSLGYINRNQQSFYTQSKALKDKAFQQTQTEIPTRKKCKRCPNSFFSICSWCSFGGFFTLLSIMSVASFASIASVCSLFSIASVLSIASTNSVLSVFSHGCTLHILTDCTERPDIHSTFKINMSKSIFDEMSKCTKSMYGQYQLTEEHEDTCGYKRVKCNYALGGNETGWMDCEVRRKGTTTWRDMDDKPSFKVKKMKYVDFTTGEITDKATVKQNAQDGGPHWMTSKITLNNGVSPGSFYQTWSEVDAYDVFRKLGKDLAPRATWTTVSLIVDDKVFRRDVYAAIETQSDKYFLDSFSKSWNLYEIEHNAIEWKRSSDNEIDKNGGDLPNRSQLTDDLSPSMSKLKEDDMIKYYIGEVLTGHWDGACMQDFKNNYYVATTDVYNDNNYTMINSGLDQTFQGCVFEMLASRDRPTCLFMKECFESPECFQKYKTELEHAEARSDIRKTQSCLDELLPSIQISLIGILVPIAVVGFLLLLVKFVPYFRRYLGNTNFRLG
jgi:hypothetical protein